MKHSLQPTAPQPAADLLTRIEELRSDLSKSERRIVEFLLRDSHSFARMNVKEVALATDVSEPTVVRFCRRVGCEGFKDLKIQIIQDLAYRQAIQEGPAAKTDAVPAPAASSSNTSEAVFAAASEALQRAHSALNHKSVEAAAQAIARARRVVIYGTGGSSGVLALEIHNRLFRLNVGSIAHTDSYLQRMSAATLSEQDVALFLSSTGRPRTLLDTLELARYYRATCIGIAPQDSALARDLDICIHLELSQGGVDQFHPNPMRYAQLYAIDCLAFAVALQSGEAARIALKRTRASVASLNGIAPQQPIGD